MIQAIVQECVDVISWVSGLQHQLHYRDFFGDNELDSLAKGILINLNVPSPLTFALDEFRHLLTAITNHVCSIVPDFPDEHLILLPLAQPVLNLPTYHGCEHFKEGCEYHGCRFYAIRRDQVVRVVQPQAWVTHLQPVLFESCEGQCLSGVFGGCGGQGLQLEHVGALTQLHRELQEAREGLGGGYLSESQGRLVVAVQDQGELSFQGGGVLLDLEVEEEGAFSSLLICLDVGRIQHCRVEPITQLACEVLSEVEFAAQVNR